MMSRIYISIFLLFTALLFSFSSEKERKLSSFTELKNEIQLLTSNNNLPVVSSESPSEKCGLWLAFEAQRLMPQLSFTEQEELRQLLSPQVLQKSRIIGRFQIYYDTTGSDAPVMLRHIGDNVEPIPGTAEEFVDSVGRFFNEVWEYEIGVLGYEQPPLGSSEYYRITIEDLGLGYYGVTYPETQVSSSPLPRMQTYITIDNDFRYVYSPSRGIPGLKVTAAHEFHHAIQLGGYGQRNTDYYFYERIVLSSVLNFLIRNFPSLLTIIRFNTVVRFGESLSRKNIRVML